MTSWADASDDPALEQAPAEFTGGAGVRPRLQLKPRSKAAAAQDSPAGGSSSIFGAAKPREAGKKLYIIFYSLNVIEYKVYIVWLSFPLFDVHTTS